MSKIELPSLDERIAGLLKAPDGVSAEVFSNTLILVRGAIAVAKQDARKAQADAFDPSVLDGTAIGKLHDTEHRVKRLENAETALTTHHQVAVKREEMERFSTEAAPLQQKITDLANEMATAYPAAVNQLVDLFQRVAAADRESANCNTRAPAGFYLRGVEASIAGGAKIIEKVVLPVVMPNGMVNAWPPRNDWALAYTEWHLRGLGRSSDA